MQHLTTVLDEIRWRYPSARVSCGAVVAGPQLRILSCSLPKGAAPLTDLPMFGSAVQQWLALLDEAGSELLVPDVSDDPRFDAIDAMIMGADTIATALFVLRQDDTVTGFLRVDKPVLGPFAPGLLEAARTAMPTAGLAVQLERERVDGWALQRKLVELETTVHTQRKRDRETVGALRIAVAELRDRLQRVATGLEPGPRQAIESSLRYDVDRVETVLRSLNDPLAEAQGLLR